MRPLLLYLALAGSCHALEDPAAHLDQMERDYEAGKEAYLVGWLKSADLSPVPVPSLEADPRKSEAERAQHLAELNLKLLALRQRRHDELSREELMRASVMQTQPREWAAIVAEADAARGNDPKAAPTAKKPHHEPTATIVKP